MATNYDLSRCAGIVTDSKDDKSSLFGEECEYSVYVKPEETVTKKSLALLKSRRKGTSPGVRELLNSGSIVEWTGFSDPIYWMEIMGLVNPNISIYNPRLNRVITIYILKQYVDQWRYNIRNENITRRLYNTMQPNGRLMNLKVMSYEK